MLGKLKAALQAKYDAGENIEVVKRIVDTLLRPGMKIIDVGPGTGSLVRHVHESAKERGIDVELHVADYLPSILDSFPGDVVKHLIDLHQLADTSQGIRRVPLPDAAYDMVFFTEVIEHITFPQIMISEFARILKPGGRLVITTPNILCLGNRLATLLGTDKLFRKVGEEGFVATIEFHAYGHVAHYSPASLSQLLSPWFSIERRTGSCFKIPALRFWQTGLASMLPNLANHIVIVAAKRDIADSTLRIAPCALTGATELTLPDGRCLHPVPHNIVCYSCPHFHKDWLHPRDRRKKASYRPR
jgi:SAM-dependent methyltransferase